MRQTIVAAVLLLASTLYASNAGATSITIQNVTVTSTVGTDTRTWCMVGCAENHGAGNIWGAFANTVVSSPSSGGNQSLVLTQNPNATIFGFNFNTSEHRLDTDAVTPCGDNGRDCVMSLNILTNLLGLVTVPLPLNNALNNLNQDPGGTNHNEAANWGLSVLNQPGGLHVWVGYADNAHQGDCADVAGTVSANCLPDNPWLGSANSVFGGAALASENCLRSGTTSCFDAGAIRIELNDPVTLPPPVPEPASMTLMGAGLASLAARRYRRRKAAQ